MKIIIVGCGKVGTALTAQLSREDNLVTVIDTDSIVVCLLYTSDAADE